MRGIHTELHHQLFQTTKIMKVVYLGTDRYYSRQASKIIQSMPCQLLVNHTKNIKFVEFPQKYDLGIALGYMHLIEKKELNKAIWLNIHPAPLPEYGGRNIAYHAILNGASEFGATLHYMDEYFDKGNIIALEKFEIPEATTAKELYDMSSQASLRLFKKYIPKFLAREKINSKKQTNHIYYKHKTINNFIDVSDNVKRRICATYFPPHFPKIKIGGKNFRIILDDEKQ